MQDSTENDNLNEVGPEAPDGSIQTNEAPKEISRTTRPPGQRICDYYLTKRGCSKGDRCDFLHEGGSVNPSVDNMSPEMDKVCAFFISERGCVKEERCDFLHPIAPNGNKTTRVCEFFQQSRGCVKAERCDFLHCRSAKKEAGEGLLGVYGANDAGGGGGGGGGGYLMDAAMRAQQHANQLAQAAGLVPAYGYATPLLGTTESGGIPKLPSGVMPAGPGGRPAMVTKGTNSGSSRVCDFYQSARGCAKQERCDFIHAGPDIPSDGASHYAHMNKGRQPQSAPSGHQGHQMPQQMPQQGMQQGAVSASIDQNYSQYYQQQPQYGYTYGHDGTMVASPMPAVQPGAAMMGPDGTVQYGMQQSMQPAMQPAMQPFNMQGMGGMQGGMQSGYGQPAIGGNKVCTYYGTARGCRKGAQCDFVHPANGNAASATAAVPTAKTSHRYAPY